MKQLRIEERRSRRLVFRNPENSIKISINKLSKVTSFGDHAFVMYDHLQKKIHILIYILNFMQITSIAVDSPGTEIWPPTRPVYWTFPCLVDCV